jgi:hypothetical protein
VKQFIIPLLCFAAPPVSVPFPHRLLHSPTPDKHLIETMPGGVAVLDFDGDGRPDLFFTNGAALPTLAKLPAQANRLYRNLGDRRWQDVTSQSGLAGRGYSMGAAAADFDGDGFTDLFVTGVRENLLYRNRGDGTFESLPFPSTGWSVSAGWFDYDHDGDLDLFVVNYVQWDPAKEPFCGDRKAGYRTYCHPRHYAGFANSLFRNDGQGRFTDVSKESGIAAHTGKGMALAFADYDRDGWLDVLVTNDAVPNFLFHNEGNGTFSERGMAAGIGLNDDGQALSSMGADFRDLDGDGSPEIFITALANETFPLFKGLPKGLFLDVTYPSRIGAATRASSGWSTGIYDFDHDGRKDIYAANGDVNDNTEVFSSRQSKQQNLFLWNTGDSRFRAEPFGEPARHRGAAFGDLNGDGAVDIVTTRLGGAPTVWFNDRARGRNWLAIRTVLGAEVQLRAGGVTQYNHATQAVGYASSSSPEVHFGLGAAAIVDEIEVRFPGGGSKVLRRQEPNQRVTVMP